MGAFQVEVLLHDEELERFVRQALGDELTSDARYVAERICDVIPEVRPLCVCGAPYDTVACRDRGHVRGPEVRR